jgi:hypothetical protein
LQTRTAWQVLRAGHAGEWRRNDLEAAWRQANQTARPRGGRGPKPEEAWQARGEVRPEERDRFMAMVYQLRSAPSVPGAESTTEELDVL